MNDHGQASRMRFALPGLCVLLCLAATGCGSSGSVSGKVSFKGEPLGGGTVLFTSEGQGSATSPIAPDGTYQIDKIPVGPVKIAVETKTAKPANPPPGVMPKPPEGAIPKDAGSSVYGPASPSKGKYVQIPDNYADPNASGLSYTVKSGAQPYDIDLK